VSAASASPARPPRRLEKPLRWIIGILLLLVLTGGLFELVLRIYDPLRLPLEDMRDFYRLDAHSRIETTPGWSGNQFVEGSQVPVQMNALGLRGVETGIRAAGERRVLMLGDSYVWGQGVRDDQTVPARLEQSLRATGANVVVGNAGMFGTSPREWGYTLDRYRGAFFPDLVVAVMYVGNDVLDTLQEPLTVVDGWLIPSGAAHVARTSWRFQFMVKSRVWNKIEKLVENTIESAALARRQPIGPGIALAEALFLDRDPARDAELPFLGEVEATLASNFRDFARASEGLRRVVVLLPAHDVALRDYADLLQENKLDPALHQRGRGHARLVRLLTAQRLEVIDLTDRILAEQDRQALFFARDWHFSQVGCAKVAEWLQPEIERRLR